MKPFLIFLCFFSFGMFNESFAQSKDYFYLYKFKYIRDSTDMTRYVRPETFVLYSSGKDSKFYPYGSFVFDSTHFELFGETDSKILSKEAGEKLFSNKDIIRSYQNWTFGIDIGKDFKKKDLYAYVHTVESSWQCKSKLEMQWEYISEKDTIKGIEVYKAVTTLGGRIWEVWYAPSIPIFDGPYKFHGTPGLILKAQDTELRYIFEYEGSKLNDKLYFSKRYKEIGTTKDCGAIIKFMHDFQKNPRYNNIIGDTGEMTNRLKINNRYKLCYLIEK